MKNKKYLILGIVTILSICFFLVITTLPEPESCNNMQIIFMKPGEELNSPFLANHPYGAIIVPEINKVIGNTKILECKNFRVSDYINLGGLDENK
jgi:hypothetical protein